MVGKIRNIAPTGGPIRIKGVVHQYYSPYWQRWITRSWPKGQGKDTPARALNRSTFIRAVALIKNLPTEDRIAAQSLAKYSPYLERDIKIKAATGTLLQFTDNTGRFWMSTRTAIQQIQPMLDSISARPGAVLFRGADYWDAVLPPVADMVLIYDLSMQAPAWMDYGDALYAMLASLNADKGTILFAGAAGWQLLAPGVSGNVLAAGGAGGDLSWVPNGGGGGGGGYSPGTAPTVVQFAYSTNSNAAVFAAPPTAGNTLIAMVFDPSTDSANSGWTKLSEQGSGLDYGIILGHVAGSSESATQTPVGGGGGTNFGVAIWELNGANATGFGFAVGQSQGEVSAPYSSPILFPNVVNCIGLSAIAVQGTTFNAVYNTGHLDIMSNTGNRPIAAAHSTLADTPIVGLLAAFAASGNSKGATCLITS